VVDPLLGIGSVQRHLEEHQNWVGASSVMQMIAIVRRFPMQLTQFVEGRAQDPYRRMAVKAD